MKKAKRKYVRKVSSEAIQSKSSGIKEDSYSNLPNNIKSDIERTLEYRKGLNLFDDSKERKERAVRYCLNRV